MTYNIHGGIGRGGRADPDAILDVLHEAEADIIALQEVNDEDAVERSFLHRLSARLPHPHHWFGPTVAKPGSRYGNLVVSRVDADRVTLIDLAVPGREPRGAVRIRFSYAGHTIQLTATHLGLAPAERRFQIDRLVADSPDDADIRILLGDLNEWRPGSPQTRKLIRRFGPAAAVRTFPARFPLLPLDRIHVQAPEVTVSTFAVRSRTARRASDHLPLIADLAWALKR